MGSFHETRVVWGAIFAFFCLSQCWAFRERGGGLTLGPLNSSRGNNATKNPPPQNNVKIFNNSPLSSNISKQKPIFAVADDALSTSPHLASPKMSQSHRELEEYVAKHGGNRVIRKILIANNGMAAAKAILSMRQWAYLEFGDEKLLEFVAMATSEDLKANAEFIRLADQIVEVPGGSNKNNYANVDCIMDVARQHKVDAVWPGWGHASENPNLPEKLVAEGIEFIGPGARVMAALGDKIAANILAQSAGVPSIPWTGDGLVVPPNANGTIPDELFQKATIHNVEQCKEAAKKIGFPIMIKASEGGGGKGIRLCERAEELEAAYAQVRAEVPNSPIFMMLVCGNARHIEVQIVGDDHGQAVALNGRDCTTQRRFQKIFEEAPPTTKVKPHTFREMELAAQRLTQSIGYRGAGTVEFLYNSSEDKFYFLELNPRLQVEHPVTEGITDINLPALQLHVSMGIPLHRVSSVRRFWNKSPEDTESAIDFAKDRYRPITKHVIAARITAENPDEGFKPTSGVIERLEFQSTPSVWGYFSVGANGAVHEYADSQFGHLFASGNTREEARKALVMALKRVEVRGEIRTAVEYLGQLLETEDFKQNNIDTAWLDSLIKDKAVSTKVHLGTSDVVVTAIIAKAIEQFKSGERAIEERLLRGNEYVREIDSMNRCEEEVTYEGVKYMATVERSGPETFLLHLGGTRIEVLVRQQADRSVFATWQNRNRRFTSREDPLGLRLNIDGSTVLIPTMYNPSELRCDVNGKVVRYLVPDGAELVKGQPYAEVEAMKMIMTLKSSENGYITKSKSAGSILSAGDLLGTLELKDASKVTRIEEYKGGDMFETKEKEQDFLSPAEMVNRLHRHMEGYAGINASDLVQKLLNSNLGSDPEKLPQTVLDLLNKYVEIESLFGTKASSRDVAYNLLREHKKDLRKAMYIQMAHAQPKRGELVLRLLRTVQNFSQRFPWTLSAEYSETLRKLSSLKGPLYGEISLEAQRLIEEKRNRPFEERCAELRKELLNSESRADLFKLAADAALSAGVDLLSNLFTDTAVQDKAMEVYVRRVYRGHRIHNLKIENKVVTFQYSERDLAPDAAPVRTGKLIMVQDVEDIADFLSTLQIRTGDPSLEPVNTCHIVLANKANLDPDSAEEKTIISQIEKICEEKKIFLRNAGIRVLNVLAPRPPMMPRYFSFHYKTHFAESRLRRDMRPTFPSLMELDSLQDHFLLERLTALHPNSQVYVGNQEGPVKETKKKQLLQTVFVRAINHDKDILSASGVRRVFSDLLDELERAKLSQRVSPIASGRIYLNVIPEIEREVEDVISQCKTIMLQVKSEFAERLVYLNVDQIELKLNLAPAKPNLPTRVFRFSATSHDGLWLHPEALEEIKNVSFENQTLKQETYIQNIKGDRKSAKADKSHYDELASKRTAARRAGSAYVYDLLGLFEVALIEQWTKSKSHDSLTKIPKDFFNVRELVISQDGELEFAEEVQVGRNSIGMVGWLMTLRTPEYPGGRDIVVIANDITFKGGSFGVEEDLFFAKASAYAREKKLPRLYLSCNSGARLGLYEKLKDKIIPAWINENNHALGFEYLYLLEHDLKLIPKEAVRVKPKIVTNKDGTQQTRYVIDAIIGEPQQHLGVENLRGSGMIAGETSRAYEEIFTLTYVTGRSVGIGAYLVRLGQRTIQHQDGPIILTGYQALNKLLGGEVYSSLDELGGPSIMHGNGVSHLTVGSDREGLAEILRWLSYVPRTSDDSVLSMRGVSVNHDPVDRAVDFLPAKGVYDPRHMFEGTSQGGKWLSGFFDRGSFKEYLSGWGKGVVVGRAKLGGIPAAVVGVDPRMVEKRIPVDPANSDSRGTVLAQAGQVWFPDSAYKTAQAIADFNFGENLPLFLFANWRGFSGGTRDMFDEILKYGSMIVDSLRKYKQPVFVYIPPGGELRGGAWVVVDSTINPKHMEMYADTLSRGGILEPSGICEIMFRKEQQIKLMHRLDPTIHKLNSQLKHTLIEEDVAKLRDSIARREDDLLPIYVQMAHAYADLHDKSGRMKAKGVIRRELEWVDSRKFFFWRLKRKLLEFQIRKQMEKVESNASADNFEVQFNDLLADRVDLEDDQKTALYLDSEEGKRVVGSFLREEENRGAEQKIRKILNNLDKTSSRTVLAKFAAPQPTVA